MEKLNELIRKSKASITIEVNNHRDYYETIDVNTLDEDREGICDDIWNKMIELDMCIRIQVYPNSPVSFFVIYHYDMEKAIDIALEYFN